MPNAEKVKLVEELTQKISGASSLFLTDFTGLSVQEITELRRSLSESAVEYQVVKNTLARLSVKSAGYGELEEYLNGPTAFAFGGEDPVAPARVIKKFSKDNEKLKFKVCIFDGALIGADQIDQIAGLPTKEVLITQLATMLNAPMSNLVAVLAGVITKFATVIDAVRQKKEESH